MCIFAKRLNLMKTIIFACLLMLASSAFSQNGLEHTYDESCDCTVVTNHYDGGQVSSVHHENNAGKRDGLETVYYENGQVQYERTWANGVLNGQGTHYHRSGNVNYQEQYTNGKKSGTWTFYDDEGTVIQSITYTGNNMDGTYDYYDAGVLYYRQVIQGGQLADEEILQQEVYDAVQEAAEAARKAGK